MHLIQGTRIVYSTWGRWHCYINNSLANISVISSHSRPLHLRAVRHFETTRPWACPSQMIKHSWNNVNLTSNIIDFHWRTMAKDSVGIIILKLCLLHLFSFSNPTNIATCTYSFLGDCLWHNAILVWFPAKILHVICNLSLVPCILTLSTDTVKVEGTPDKCNFYLQNLFLRSFIPPLR